MQEVSDVGVRPVGVWSRSGANPGSPPAKLLGPFSFSFVLRRNLKKKKKKM